MSSTQQIANRLVELCREGKYEQCYDELFAADAQNIEMPAMAEGPLGNASGLAAIRAKGQAWMERSRRCTTAASENLGSPATGSRCRCRWTSP